MGTVFCNSNFPGCYGEPLPIFNLLWPQICLSLNPRYLHKRSYSRDYYCHCSRARRFTYDCCDLLSLLSNENERWQNTCEKLELSRSHGISRRNLHRENRNLNQKWSEGRAILCLIQTDQKFQKEYFIQLRSRREIYQDLSWIYFVQHWCQNWDGWLSFLCPYWKWNRCRNDQVFARRWSSSPWRN